MIRPELRVFAPGDYAAAAADEIARAIEKVTEGGGRCRVALAGGGTPRPIYEKLAAPPLAGRIDWDRVEILWGDERCVPPDDPQSNYRMARQALVDHVAVPAAQVHRIEGERPPAEAARAYAEVLGEAPIDVLLLGMGGDGHTASLFPDTPEPPADAPVVATHSPAGPRDRVSLSFSAINRSAAVFFLVAGAGKAERLAEVLGQIESGDATLPAARVQPADGRLVWILDTEAASRLPEEIKRGSE